MPGEGGDVRLLEVRSSFLLNARDLTMDCKGDGVVLSAGARFASTMAACDVN